MKEIVEKYIDNYRGLAFIRDVDDLTLLYSNDNYQDFMKENSLNLAIKKKLTLEAGFAYCAYVDEVFLSNKKSTFACELMGHKVYVSLRLCVKYQGKEQMLTLIDVLSTSDDCLINTISL